MSDWIACRVNETPAPLEALYLPIDMRRDLCLSLLEESGARSINLREERGEIIHCCVMPWHDENHPSASLNFDKMVYRCLGCSAKGGLLWLIATIKGVTGPEAREWLAGESGVGGKEFQLAPLLQFLDSLDDAISSGRAKPVIPKYAEVVLEPWSHIYPGLTTGAPDLGIEGRGIPEANLIEARVGWDMDANRVIIPNFHKGDLVGWQSRRILNDGTPKYKSTPDFPRESTIYGAPEDKSRIVVVESPMSQLRHRHHLPVGATWGSVITPAQIQILKWYREVIFWPDNDPAGWKTIEGYTDEQGKHHLGPAQQLEPYTSVTVVDSDWHADPAQFDEEAAQQFIADRVPLAVWTKPTGALRCLACKEKHGGPCS